jgi:ribosomal protein L16 Arg81 hydroxylase
MMKTTYDMNKLICECLPKKLLQIYENSNKITEWFRIKKRRTTFFYSFSISKSMYKLARVYRGLSEGIESSRVQQSFVLKTIYTNPW